MKKWTVKAAVSVIKGQQKVEDIKEIVSSYPMFAMAVAMNDISALASLIGDSVTLDMLEVNQTAEAENDTKAKDTDGVSGSDDPFEGMTNKDLVKLCKDNGISVPAAGRNRQFYIGKLADAGITGPDAVEAEPEDDDAAGAWEDLQPDPYEGKTAKELHAMCKERGIKADIKKPAKFYADLLRKADEEEAEDDSDDWGDEDAEEPPKAVGKGNSKVTPIKNAKGAAKGKTAPQKAAASDDDWDI